MLRRGSGDAGGELQAPSPADEHFPPTGRQQHLSSAPGAAEGEPNPPRSFPCAGVGACATPSSCRSPWPPLLAPCWAGSVGRGEELEQFGKKQAMGAKINFFFKKGEKDLASPSVLVILLCKQIWWEEEKEKRQKSSPVREAGMLHWKEGKKKKKHNKNPQESLGLKPSTPI